jgi:hypothetical protein
MSSLCSTPGITYQVVFLPSVGLRPLYQGIFEPGQLVLGLHPLNQGTLGFGQPVLGIHPLTRGY